MSALHEAIQHMKPGQEMVAALVADHYRKFPQLRQQMNDNPRQALEQILKNKINSKIQILTHSNTEEVWHLPLPATEAPAMTEDQLAQISAGEVGVAAIVVGSGVLVAGVVAGLAAALTQD